MPVRFDGAVVRKVLSGCLFRAGACLAGLTRAVRLMVALQRKISDVNPGVGRHAMAVTVPRQRTANAVLAKVDEPVLNNLNTNFCYFDDRGFDFKQLGPHMAGGGWAWGDFAAEADPSNPNNQKVGGRLLKGPKPPPEAPPADE